MEWQQLTSSSVRAASILSEANASWVGGATRQSDTATRLAGTGQLLSKIMLVFCAAAGAGVAGILVVRACRASLWLSIARHKTIWVLLVP